MSLLLFMEACLDYNAKCIHVKRMQSVLAQIVQNEECEMCHSYKHSEKMMYVEIIHQTMKQKCFCLLTSKKTCCIRHFIICDKCNLYDIGKLTHVNRYKKGKEAIDQMIRFIRSHEPILNTNLHFYLTTFDKIIT